jgi:hypothetical protein
MLATAGFTALADHLRRELALKVGDGWLMFYTLSFTYSVYALTTGASWLNFAVNQSALPWLALGILQKTWRHALGLIVLFSVHEILGGHLEPTVSNSIFLTVFAGAVSLYRRSPLPLTAWTIGTAIAGIVLLPVEWPMLTGFFASARAGGVSVADMQSNYIPIGLFPTSLFVGMALWIVHPPMNHHTTYTLALTSCAAAWCVIPALAGRARWRSFDLVAAFMVLFALLMVCRPVWIAEMMSHLPVLKSMRWPFRELMQFLFFFHIFLLVRPPGYSASVRRIIAILSTCVLVIPLYCYFIPPSFNAMTNNRQVVLSGEFDRYWDKVRSLLKPGDRIAVLIPYRFYVDQSEEKPFELLGTYNYAILDRVINVSGYSLTVPQDQLYLRTLPDFPSGAFDDTQKPDLLREKPDLKFITLVSLHPLKITLSSRDVPDIDLTPYVPESFKSDDY